MPPESPCDDHTTPASPHRQGHASAAQQARVQAVGGSDSDYFNQMLANQTLGALWVAHSDDEERNRQFLAASAALIGARPQNELEGMLISQMIACHAASLECHRRAMLPEQTIEGRQVNLTAASRLSRTYVALLEGLSRHRARASRWSGSSTDGPGRRPGDRRRRQPGWGRGVPSKK